MKIIENREQWRCEFEAGWLANFHETGKADWKRYPKIRNRDVDPRPGLVLDRSRLGLISSAGASLRAQQVPFDASNVLGDYSIRTFSTNTRYSEIAFSHVHYDQSAVDSDPQVLLPFEHLQDLEREGGIGSLALDVVSFMGYQPDVTRVVDEMIPDIVEHTKEQGWNAALLVPS